MKTFQTLYGDFSTITKDNSTSNVTWGKKLINDTQKNICNLADFTFLDDEMYASSVASQQSYRLPPDYLPNSLSNVYVSISSVKYYPKEIISSDEFEKLSVDTSTGTPQFYYIYKDYINFYPLPVDTGWTIYAKYRKMPRDMSADDYTTGTITATLNSRVIDGSGTTFTVAMNDRWILLPDGIWYQIQEYDSATSIVLYKTYEGTTTAGATYTIGECPIIPDGFQELLVYKPLEHYFMMTGEEKRASFYKNLYDAGFRDLKSRYLSRSSNQVFVQGDTKVINPNDYPTGLI